jgi:hypothetical protein
VNGELATAELQEGTIMGLFAHHIAVEIFGREFSPETPLEHVMVFGLTGVVFALAVYGLYAGARDWKRWRRQQREAVTG